MAIQTVKVTINGTEHTLEYNSSTQKWEKTITAPTTTSYNRTGGYYPVSVTATNQAGTSNTITDADDDNLKLVVKERILPVIVLTSPSSGAYVTNNKPSIQFNVTDELGGSGVKESTIVLKIDNTTITTTKTAITNGFQCTGIPTTALSDGSHTITITASDNDGNNATTVTSTFKVDTVPPSLSVSSPASGLVTATTSVTVAGSTNDSTSSPVTIAIKVNNKDDYTATVNNKGEFSKAVTLREGSNTIAVTATDSAGKTATLTKTVTVDTSTPEITSVTITPNPVDAGETMVISVEVS